MGQFLTRYMEGECEAVWTELTSAGEAAMQPPLADDAIAVASEMVNRIVHNANIIGQYLADAGYEFETPGPFVTPASEDTTASLEQIEREFGAVPLFLKAWWSRVDQLNHQPTESFRDSGQGCATEGIYPVSGILIASPADCLSTSRERLVRVQDHIGRTDELGIDGEEDYYASSSNLVIGPMTSANDPVGFRLPLQAVDGVCHPAAPDEDEESLVDWLRFYYLSRGGLGWNYFGYVPKPDGSKQLRTYIRPPEEVRSIVQSMNLVPF